VKYTAIVIKYNDILLSRLVISYKFEICNIFLVSLRWFLGDIGQLSFIKPAGNFISYQMQQKSEIGLFLRYRYLAYEGSTPVPPLQIFWVDTLMPHTEA
jgi:hypothetical protein